jgi:hypothetical protein
MSATKLLASSHTALVKVHQQPGTKVITKVYINRLLQAQGQDTGHTKQQSLKLLMQCTPTTAEEGVKEPMDVEEEEEEEQLEDKEEEQEKELEEEEQEEKHGEEQVEEEKGVELEEEIGEEEKKEEKAEEALEEEWEEELEVEKELEEEEHQVPPRKCKLVEEEHKKRKRTHPVVIDLDKEMEVEEIKTKPHKQPVVCQYSKGNTKEQCKEAARLLALPDLELGMYTLCVFTVHHTDKFQTNAHQVFYLSTCFPMHIRFFICRLFPPCTSVFLFVDLFPNVHWVFYLSTFSPMHIGFLFVDLFPYAHWVFYLTCENHTL